MVADPGEHVGEPGPRIDVVHLGGDNRREHGCRPLAAAIRAGEQPRLPAQSDPTQRAFGGIVKGHAAQRRHFPVELSATETYRWAAGIGVSGAPNGGRPTYR